jgi:coenzyme F420-0:L-glutamate ligase / coenzyme F420-1:gamma-L-glutamate ligase
MNNMEIIPIKTKRLLKNPLPEIFKIIKGKLSDGDIVALTSKIISLEHDGLINLRDVVSSPKAQKLAKKYAISPQFAELVIKESDEILGGVKRAILTLKNGILMANAGIDASNVPLNYVVKLPHNLEVIADEIRRTIKKITGKNIGVIISDSVCLPLRFGTHHYALAISGFFGIVDERGKKDLFQKPMKITTHNIADEIASAAGLIMGERSERIPAVIIRGLAVKFTNLSAKKLTKELIISRQGDLFRDVLKLNK